MYEYLFTIWVVSVIFSGTLMTSHWEEFVDGFNRRHLADKGRPAPTKKLFIGTAITIFCPILNSFVAVFGVLDCISALFRKDE